MPIPAHLAAAFASLALHPECHTHPPLRTVADAHAHWDALDGAQVKNLFLKDAGGQLWLVVVPGDPRMDTKAMAALIGARRISFGNADLLAEVLGVAPGSVTPLAVLNDTQKRVRAVLHAGLLDQRRLLVHPLVNTATVPLAPADLLRFMAATHRPPDVVDLTGAFMTPA